MAKILYTANAHVTGGRSGHGRTTDGALDVDLRVPKEMGGEGGGTNPEGLCPVGDRSFKLSASPAVPIPDVSDRDAAVELVRRAHEVCPYSNATRGNID